MAEAPPGGLYEANVDAVIEGDRLEVLGAPFGPAGIAAVELPDGSVWEVDHLDPGRLVGLGVGATDPAGSPLLVAAFGGDGSMRIVDAAGTGQPFDKDLGVESQVFSIPRHGGTLAADAAGRLVLLADLAQDPSLDPLARVLAVVELTVLTRSTPGGDLFEPLLPGLLGVAESLAADTDATGHPSIGGGQKRIHAAFGSFRRRFADSMPATDRLIGELLDPPPVDRYAFDADFAMPSAHPWNDDDAVIHSARSPAAPPVSDTVPPAAEDYVGVERISPSVIEVTATRSDAERWVRVLRRDGLILLAQAPMERRGLMDRAEVLLPPDTLDDELEVQVLDADRLTDVSGRPSEVIRSAVRAGRAAAAAERRQDLGAAWRHWQRCSARWGEVGDAERAESARSRTVGTGRRFRGEPLFADEVDPFGDVGS